MIYNYWSERVLTIVGYRIPATDIKANKQLGQLGHLIERPSTSTSTSTSSKPNKYRVSNVTFFTTWSTYHIDGKPVYSSDYEARREYGDRLAKMTRPLWQEVSCYMRVLSPGQYNQLDRSELPEGMKSLVSFKQIFYAGRVIFVQSIDKCVRRVGKIM